MMTERIIKIEDITDPKLDMYIKKRETALLHYYEPDIGIFLAESENVVQRAIAAGYEPLSFMIEERLLEQMEYLYRDFDVPVFTADINVMIQMVGFTLIKGVLCAMRRKPLLSVEQICENASRIVLMEDVENPMNVGSIFRNAAALGFDAVVLTDDSSDPLYRRAARVSVGTVFQIPWTKIKTDNIATELKKYGFKTVSMALRDDAVMLGEYDFAKEEKLAVIMGNEFSGIRSETLKECDMVVKIPMGHGVDSLNVSTASAIAFWEMRKR